MSDGKVIGNQGCAACGETATVKEGKNGTLSIHCGACGTQSIVKSPKAVAALRSRLGVTAPAPAPKQDDNWLAKL